VQPKKKIHRTCQSTPWSHILEKDGFGDHTNLFACALLILVGLKSLHHIITNWDREVISPRGEAETLAFKETYSRITMSFNTARYGITGMGTGYNAPVARELGPSTNDSCA
jgi:hypothetical protein